MLPIHKISSTELHKIRTACSYLFSPKLARQDEFLRSLKLASVKNAFREKAKRYHPDVHGDEPGNMVERRRERFIKIRESYEILTTYIFEEDKSVSARSVRQRKIIAVGGAKGGIGKSIFAANLGVLLSSMGSKTVLVDMDLGGANLHLYLGETSLAHTVNDFLTGRVPTLTELMVPSRYGPHLIGGDSSHLGAANIAFSRKLKLLRSIKEIDGDYIIVDLGGDTSYNIIDFFLAADHGIVLTTCDPASYLDAYNFIKVALYRKLNRLFGPESAFRDQKDTDLERLINEATMSSNGNKVESVGQLIEKVRKEQPWHLSLMTRVLKAYNPHLIVNMIAGDSNVTEVVDRIQEVSQKMLSLQVGHLGSIAYQPEIKNSARDLIPVVARYPNGILSQELKHIIDKVGH